MSGFYTFSASGVKCLFVVVFKETKPSSQDGGDKKDGEYIKLKVIGQVCMHAGVMDGHHWNKHECVYEAWIVIQSFLTAEWLTFIFHVYLWDKYYGDTCLWPICLSMIKLNRDFLTIFKWIKKSVIIPRFTCTHTMLSICFFKLLKVTSSLLLTSPALCTHRTAVKSTSRWKWRHIWRSWRSLTARDR